MARVTATFLHPEDAPPSLYGVDGKPQFFTDPAMDRFVAVLLNTVSELWVQTERVETLTRLIEHKGLATPDDLDQVAQVDDARREEALQAFVARLLAPLRETAS
jgi:hypothetical protein